MQGFDILVTDSRGTRHRITVDAESANDALKGYMNGCGTRPYRGKCRSTKGKLFEAVPEVTP